MPYTIVSQPRAWWPVAWTGVTEDGAQVENMIELRFLILKVDAAAAWIRRVIEAQTAEREPDADLAGIYAGLVQEVAVDWRGVLAENGDPLPWSTDNLNLLMNEGGLFTHVFEAFRQLLAGGEKARLGN